MASGTGGEAEVLLVPQPPDSAAALGETTYEQPADAPASSAVKAMQGHLIERVRNLAGLLRLPGAGISGDVA
jgi:hypothetical protein